jgi:hypothetical protein
VLRDVAPLDPVRDAAHTGAEVPAPGPDGLGYGGFSRGTVRSNR